MGKLGQVDEIADFVVFLLSDRSGVVTGSVIDWDQNVIGGLGLTPLVALPLYRRRQTMRLGLIGLGRIGAFHADTLPSLAAVDSLVVTDAVPAVTSGGRRPGRRRGRRLPESLIGSGRRRHRHRRGHRRPPRADQGRRRRRASRCSARSRCPATIAEAVAIARHVNDSGVPVQIGYPRRFDPAFAAARAAVEAGELGWVHTVRSTTLDPAPPPRGYIEVSGGIFRDCSVHDFDTVRWVTGREVVEVYADRQSPGAPTSSPTSATSPPPNRC